MPGREFFNECRSRFRVNVPGTWSGDGVREVLPKSGRDVESDYESRARMVKPAARMSSLRTRAAIKIPSRGRSGLSGVQQRGRERGRRGREVRVCVDRGMCAVGRRDNRYGGSCTWSMPQRNSWNSVLH